MGRGGPRRVPSALYGLCGALALTVCLAWLLTPGCALTPRTGVSAFTRSGDEIVACGQYFHTGAPVVLWTDPGGYDAYRVDKRFAPLDKASWENYSKEGAAKGPETPNRYGIRKAGLTEEELGRVRGGGWDLPLLQRQVDQFVLHYDVCGTSRQCFRVLHDLRGLSVHFMLDIDGTIYQTLDLKERAWHGGTANDRSIGIEIANIGAYQDPEKGPITKWYARDEKGLRITIPDEMGDGGLRTPGFVGRPVRQELVTGEIQGKVYKQYDLTSQQYDSLIKLTGALCSIFPKIRCDYPRDSEGQLISHTLDPQALAAFTGVLGHYHLTDEKLDPGPAMQWETVVRGARGLITGRRRGD